jgi:hypothetical protein
MAGEPRHARSYRVTDWRAASTGERWWEVTTVRNNAKLYVECTERGRCSIYSRTPRGVPLGKALWSGRLKVYESVGDALTRAGLA